MSDHPATIEPAHARAPFYWGIDIGGTGIKIGLLDDTGKTLAYHQIPTLESEGPDAAVQRMVSVVEQVELSLGIADQVRSVGLGAPGPIDLSTGYLVAPPQLPSWWNFPIRDRVQERLDRPVAFLNDANAAAYGEFWIGSGRDDDSMVLLTLGTGVGAGIIVHRQLINGVNSFGSECGHIIVDSSHQARLCAWGGGRGQLEAYASASGVVMRTRQRLSEGAESSLDNGELTAKDVYLAAVDGDALALEIIDETARWLGIGITTLVHTVDPGLVVLGGAMDFGGADSPVGRRFLAGISDEFRDRTFDNVYRGTKIIFAALGADAGYLGVAGYARDRWQQHSGS